MPPLPGLLLSILRYTVSTIASITAMFVIGYGILGGFAALSGPPALHMVLFLVCVLLLAYLEGLQIAILEVVEVKDMERWKKEYGSAVGTMEMMKRVENSVTRFLAGRQVLVLLTVYITAQLTTYPTLTHYPFSPTPIPTWLRTIVLDTGLPGALTVVALGQLVPQLIATTHPWTFLNLPGARLVVYAALVVEALGFTHFAWLSSSFLKSISNLPPPQISPHSPTTPTSPTPLPQATTLHAQQHLAQSSDPLSSILETLFSLRHNPTEDGSDDEGEDGVDEDEEEEEEEEEEDGEDGKSVGSEGSKSTTSSRSSRVGLLRRRRPHPPFHPSPTPPPFDPSSSPSFSGIDVGVTADSPLLSPLPLTLTPQAAQEAILGTDTIPEDDSVVLEAVSSTVSATAPHTASFHSFLSPAAISRALVQKGQRVPRFLLPPSHPDHVPPHIVACGLMDKLRKTAAIHQERSLLLHQVHQNLQLVASFVNQLDSLLPQHHDAETRGSEGKEEAEGSRAAKPTALEGGGGEDTGEGVVVGEEGVAAAEVSVTSAEALAIAARLERLLERARNLRVEEGEGGGGE